jgi:hypothetical protein
LYLIDFGPSTLFAPAPDYKRFPRKTERRYGGDAFRNSVHLCRNVTSESPGVRADLGRATADGVGRSGERPSVVGASAGGSPSDLSVRDEGVGRIQEETSYTSVE